MIRYLLVATLLVTPAYAAKKKEPAQKQETPKCFSVDQLSKALAKGYGEHPHFIGSTQEGNALTIFSNPQTGTFSVILITPQGAACPLSDGTHWHALKTQPEEGNPS